MKLSHIGLVLALSLALVAAPACRTAPTKTGIAPPPPAEWHELLRATLLESDLSDPDGPRATRAVDLEVLALGWLERGHPRDAILAYSQAAVLHREIEVEALRARIQRIAETERAKKEEDPRDAELAIRRANVEARRVDVHATARSSASTAARQARDAMLGTEGLERLRQALAAGPAASADPPDLPPLADPALGAALIDALAIAAGEEADPVTRQLGALGLALAAAPDHYDDALAAVPDGGIMLALLETGALLGSRAEPILRNTLGEGRGAFTRVHAALALGQIPTTAGRGDLQAVAQRDSEAVVRLAARIALVKQGDPASREAVLAALDSKELPLRQLATFGARLIPPDEALVRALLPRLDDPEGTVRALAAAALAAAMNAGVPANGDGAGPAPLGRRAIVETLAAKVKEEPIRPAIASALTSTIADARPFVETLLTDSDAAGHALAIEVVGGSEDPALVRQLLGALLEGQLADDEREPALVALGRASRPAGVPVSSASGLATEALIEGPDGLRRAATVFFVLSDATADIATCHALLDESEAAPYAALVLVSQNDDRGVTFVNARLGADETPAVLQMAELLSILPSAAGAATLRGLVRYEDEAYFPTDAFVGWAARRALARLHLGTAAAPP